MALRSALIVGQVALSVVVLDRRGTVREEPRALQAVDTGLDPSHVVTASFALELNGYDEAAGGSSSTPPPRRVSALPASRSAAFGNIVAFSDYFWISGATLEGYDQAPGRTDGIRFQRRRPGLLQDDRRPLAAGREFTARDTTVRRSSSWSTKRRRGRYWPGQNAVGKRIKRGHWLEVVGVVRDTRVKKVSAPATAHDLPALLQDYTSDVTVHVRSAADPRSLLARVRRRSGDRSRRLGLQPADAVGAEGRVALCRAALGDAAGALRRARARAGRDRPLRPAGVRGRRAHA
jgi:hypothetical protein